MERVAAEIDWCGRNGIQYVFNADSNFGIHPRDLEIADILAQTKERHGFPEKFRSCFTKNADDRIYDLAMKLVANKLEKGITLSFQTLNEQVLHNIKRQNIRLSTYQNLLGRFNDAGVPVYTELILGLPGETVNSWISGLEQVLKSGLKGQLFIYPCEIYPNSEMGDPEYLRRFGIEKRRILLTEIHGAMRLDALLPEYQEIIVATDHMRLEEWRIMMVLSWLTMTLFSMKLGFFLLGYLRDRFGIPAMAFVQYLMQVRKDSVIGQEIEFYNGHLDALLSGERGRGVLLPDHGDIYWDMEEASFVRVVSRMEVFYGEFKKSITGYLTEQGISYDPAEVHEAIIYQRMRMPQPVQPLASGYRFSWNFPEYFDHLLDSARVALVKEQQDFEVIATDYGDDNARFAREVILWGRKSDRLLNPVSWLGGSARRGEAA
jgi:putative methyltransferase